MLTMSYSEHDITMGQDTDTHLVRVLTALSLFSGAGGMDVGLLQAGFDVRACVEIDPYCCETLRAAAEREKRHTRVLEADIRNIDPAELMGQLGLDTGELCLLAGGPPCQSFSQIGKQLGLDDERGSLLFQMPRFAEVFQPKVILMEQVKGLLSARDSMGNRGGVFAMLLSELTRLGYIVKWRVLNAADYGVPQLRQRVFLAATRETNGFVFPEPTHAPLEHRASLFPLPRYVTVGDVIDGLGPPAPKEDTTRIDSHIDVTPAGDRLRIHGVPEGSFLSAQRHLPIQQRGRLTHKDTTKFLRVSRTRPANTLRCGEVFFHPIEDRYLTPREYMRIHGYPDTYLLKGPIRGRSGRVRHLDQHRQVANSVPPPVAKALAEQIEMMLSCQESSKSLAIQ